MIERIIVLSGKIKGVAKCLRSSGGELFCEFASSKLLDIIVAYDDIVMLHSSKRSGEICIMGMQTARNIGIALMDGNDIVAHGKCGNGMNAASLAVFAKKLKNEKEISEIKSAVPNIIQSETIESKVESKVDYTADKIYAHDISVTTGYKRNENNNVDEIFLQQEIDEFINDDKSVNDDNARNDKNKIIDQSIELSILDTEPDLSEKYNESDSDNSENNKDLFNESMPLDKADFCDNNTKIIENLQGTNEIGLHCGNVCEKMMNDRFENDYSDTQTPFYIKISNQLRNLFDTYPRDKNLEELVHESAWVRVPFGDDEYYVVGVISEAEQPIFICYGLPRQMRDDPCPELTQHAEWLPTDRTNVDGNGYWVMYQDAVSGENF